MEILTADELNEIRTKALTENKDAASTQEVESKSTSTPTGTAEVIAVEEKVAPDFSKVSEEDFLKIAAERGLKVSKETLSPESQKKQEEIEEAEKYKFALEQGLTTAEAYQEAKSILASEGNDLTKKEFFKAYKDENKGATKDEADAAYNDYYFIQQNVKTKELQKKKDDEGYESEVEVEVEKTKWEDRLVNLGNKKLTADEKRIKENAKSYLENINAAYSTHKLIQNKSAEYSKVAEQVIDEIDFSALPVTYKFKDKKEIKAIVKLDDEAKADVLNYVNTVLPQFIVRTNQYNDKAEIDRQIKSYIKERYSDQVGESIYTLGRTHGMNEGKVGASAPLEREVIHDDTVISDLEKSVADRLPDNPIMNKKR